MPEANKKLFHAAHYNAIAKDIREAITRVELALPTGEAPGNRPMATACIRSIGELATILARRFLVDNEEFLPYKFLDQCSPDTDLYPLSELWED